MHLQCCDSDTKRVQKISVGGHRLGPGRQRHGPSRKTAITKCRMVCPVVLKVPVGSVSL
jgi:hypothetical protein